MKVCTKCRFLQDQKNDICYRCGSPTEQNTDKCRICGKEVGILALCYDCTYNEKTLCNRHSHFKPCPDCRIIERKGMPIGL